MHVVLSILPQQLAQAEALLERIANLGGVSQFPCLIVSAGEQDLAKCHQLASSAFQGVTVLLVDMPPNYPSPANVLFTRTAYHMGMVVNDGYLYLEPDSWPTSPTWLKDIVFAYRENGCRFMGKLATMKLPRPLETEEHYMMATGVYPANFYAESDLIRQVPVNIPADKFLQGEIVYRGKAHNSGLFVGCGEDYRNAALIVHRVPKSDEEVKLPVPVKTPESVMAAQNPHGQFPRRLHHHRGNSVEPCLIENQQVTHGPY